MQHKHQDDARDPNEQAGPDGVGAQGSQRLPNPDSDDSEQPDPKEVNPLRLVKSIEAIRQEFPAVAVQMELQIGFGLRLNESLQFEPFRCDSGNKILVYRGTKQGSWHTPRALRHASAAAGIKSVSGLPAPLEQELPSSVYRQHPAALSQLQQQVTEHLGHSPTSITAAYVGAVPVLGRLQ